MRWPWVNNGKIAVVHQPGGDFIGKVIRQG
jgi:hypothetical protein